MFKFKAKLTSLKRKAQSVKLSIDKDQDLMTTIWYWKRKREEIDSFPLLKNYLIKALRFALYALSLKKALRFAL